MPPTATMLEIKDAIDLQAAAFEMFRNKYENKFSNLESSLQERIEDLESRQSQPRNSNHHQREENPAYTKAFMSWLRKRGVSPQDEAAMMEIERKDMIIGSGPAGGYAVPKEIQRDIEAHELRMSPVRGLVKVVQAGTSDFHYLLNLRGTSSGWSSETGTRSATSTPTLRDINPTHGELYAYPVVSQWALDDVFFDLRSWLIENVADEFALRTGIAVISGDGTNKPTGMLNSTPVTTADWASPLRAQAVYQYVACSNSPIGVSMDCLITLTYTLNSSYRANASFVMNSNTAAAVRKLKDSQNQYLWQPSSIAGQPDMLLGYPVKIWEDLSDVGANNFPVGFGDFNRGYVLVDRGPIRVLSDPLTTPGMVKFYCSRRLGGAPLNNDAIKWLRTT